MEINEECSPTIYDQSPQNDEYLEIETTENDSFHEYFEKESEYVDIELIENQIPQVFVQRPHEHDYYTMDFIEDNIYNIFTQRFEFKLAPVLIERYIIFDELVRSKN